MCRCAAAVVVENLDVDAELNSKLIKIIEILRNGGGSGSDVIDIDGTKLTLLQPFLKFPVRCENIIRSLQDGVFANGIFAKMAPQLRKVTISKK